MELVTTLLGVRLILNRGDALCMSPFRAPISITCLAGRIYVTQTGDQMDYTLEPRSYFASAPRGTIDVACFACSTIEVQDDYLKSRLSTSPAIAPARTIIQGRIFQTASSRKAASPRAKSAGFTMALVHTGE